MSSMRARRHTLSTMIGSCLAVGLLQIAFVPQLEILADDDTTTALVPRVLDEAPLGWAKLKEAVSAVEGRATIKETSIDGKGEARIRQIDFKMNQSSFVFIDTTKTPIEQTSPSSAGGRNLKYSFSLSRKAENEKWNLLQVGTEEPSNPYALAREVGFLRYLEAPWTIVGQDLSAALASGKCQLRRAQETEGGRVTIAFDMAFPLENQPPGAGNRSPSVTVKGGRALLNPASCWRIEEYDLVANVELGKTSAFEFQSAGTFQYGSLGAEDLPVIKHVTYRRASLDGKDGTVSECEIDNLKVRDIPQSELLLTAFGLPEVTHTEAPNPPSTAGGIKVNEANVRGGFPWLLVGNLVVLVSVVAIFFARRVAINKIKNARTR
ncbi:hypothetical protein [Schlesneria paludicola]|uniref:hypothetical protein n=1 Tax=Schlesneria paludicola TaxID=360056 RepID=UPI00029A22C6|nr:hypothetical protein [Schlesneria paludicola]